MNLNDFYQELDNVFKTKDVKSAEKYILENLEYAKDERNTPAIVAISNELGGIYRVTSRFEEAKKVYAVALEALKILGLENTEQHGTILLNLASVYSESKEYKEALNLYEQVTHIFANSGLDKDYRMAALYNNISHVYDGLEQEEKALESAEKSLDIIRQLTGQEVELATTHTTLAQRYIKKQRYDEAENSLKLAERIFSSLPGKLNVHCAATLNTLGDLYYIQGNPALASKYFAQAMDMIKTNYGENTSYFDVAKNLAKAKSMINQEICTANNISKAKNKRQTGLELAESYYMETGRKMIQEAFPEYEKYMAIGLVGEGSECLGFDDEVSEDHDFGAGFCIWLPDHIFQEIGFKLQKAYDNLPKPARNDFSVETPEGKGRTGVFSIGEFYKKYIGCPGIPKNNVEWLLAPEISLSTATNGKVFQDNLGEFTRIRNGLLNFYPKDVFLKKIVARMAQMSQSGQYNYQRCMKRGQYSAAYLSCSEFIKATISMIYLLNRKYMPFYKWMFQGLDKMEQLPEIKSMLERLINIPDTMGTATQKIAIIEDICIIVNKELNRQGITSGSDPFLGNHCRNVMDSINDPQIKNLPIIYDGK